MGYFLRKVNMNWVIKKIQKIRDKLLEEYFNIEKRNDLTDDEKISKIIHHTAGACATVASQPLPFADIFLLTPIQFIMAKKISDIRGKPLTEKKAEHLTKEITGVIGLGYLAQQSAIALYKIGLPFFGGLMTLPLVYGLTCGIGSVVDFYFTNSLEEKDLKLYRKELKRVFKENVKKWRKTETATRMIKEYKKLPRFRC